MAFLRDRLRSLTNPPAFSLSGDHNLFNPVTWKVRRNEWFPFKATITGPTALEVTDIRPLYFTLGLESQQGVDGFNMVVKHDWHDVGPTRDGMPASAKRRPFESPIPSLAPMVLLRPSHACPPSENTRNRSSRCRLQQCAFQRRWKDMKRT